MSRSVLGAEAAISGKLTGSRVRRMSDLASTSSRRNGVSVVGDVAAPGSPIGSTDVGMRFLFASGLTSVAEAVGSAVMTACCELQPLQDVFCCLRIQLAQRQPSRLLRMSASGLRRCLARRRRLDSEEGGNDRSYDGCNRPDYRHDVGSGLELHDGDAEYHAE